MATSGKLQTNGYQVAHGDRNLILNWSVDSQSVEKNQTVISYSLVGGGSYKTYPMTSANFYLEIDGEAVFKRSSRLDLYQGTVVTSGKKTITHNEDGSRKFRVYVEAGIYEWSDPNCFAEGEFELPTIARASAPTASAAETAMGDTVTIYTNRKSDAFTHTLKYTLGGTEGTIASDVKDSCKWAVPLTLAKLIPNAVSGKLTILCQTYNGTTLVGTKSTEITVTVPDDENTKPSVTMKLSPVADIPAVFAGLYIKGKTKVKAAFSAESEHSNVKSYKLSVSGMAATGNPATSGVLAVSGEIKVTGTVTDTRGYSRSVAQTITVLPYDMPRVIPANGQNMVVCERCLTDGTPDPGGLNLLIKAGRKYSQVVADGVQKNFCTLRYRHKTAGAANWSDWVTLIEEKDILNDELSVVAVGVVPSATTTYHVQIGVVDTMGSQPPEMDFVIPTDAVAFHLRAGGRGAGFGKYGEVEGGLDMGFFIEMNQNKLTGLPEPQEDGEAVPMGYFKSNVAGFSRNETYNSLYQTVSGVAQWMNPPMVPGVEYCTLERYEGKPVYTKLISCGAVSGGATYTIGHGTSYTKIVRAAINAGRYPLPYIYNGDPTSQYSITGRIDASNIYISLGSGLSSYEAYAQIWYI